MHTGLVCILFLLASVCKLANVCTHAPTQGWSIERLMEQAQSTSDPAATGAQHSSEPDSEIDEDMIAGGSCALLVASIAKVWS